METKKRQLTVPQASGCGYHSLKKYLLVGLAK
jgi:hypothetical protein